MGRLFGTDGVRGLANRDLTAELALDLAVAAAHILAESGQFAHGDSRRPLAVVGRDPRASGEFLEAAVVAGLASAGVDVLRVGVLPTPAVSWLTAQHDADLGVMLSASHNPMPDNGIKLFARGGHKLDDALEDRIEARMGEHWERPTGAAVGRVTTLAGAGDEYVAHLVRTIPHRLEGLTVVVDCANGAASVVGPQAYRLAGAEVIAIHASPDGLNINDGCGSTHLDVLRRAVVKHGADVGVAHDGDADRFLAIDETGAVVDGDQILALLALAMRERGDLVDDAVVTTVMANLGFTRAMGDSGISVVSTAVGDRYVLEAMRAGGLVLGGEQSGHIIMSTHATTGDGVLSALHTLSRVAQVRRPLSEVAAVMTRVPQVLVNVSGVDKSRVFTDSVVCEARDRAEELLGTNGRVLLRASGTEPLVRVMVEAFDALQAQQVAEDLAAVVAAQLSLS